MLDPQRILLEGERALLRPLKLFSLRTNYRIAMKGVWGEAPRSFYFGEAPLRGQALGWYIVFLDIFLHIL